MLFQMDLVTSESARNIVSLGFEKCKAMWAVKFEVTIGFGYSEDPVVQGHVAWRELTSIVSPTIPISLGVRYRLPSCETIAHSHSRDYQW